MATVVMGSWFWLTGHVQFPVMSFALAGSLTAFFLYSVFGEKNKLFMEDLLKYYTGNKIEELV